MNMFALPDEEILPSERVLNAASVGKLDDLKKALNEGGDPNYIRLDIAPTLITAMRDYKECLQVLLEKGGSVTLPNKLGWTALHEVSIKETSDLLQVVIDYSTSLNLFVKDKEMKTAFFAAIENNRFNNAQLLWKHEPDLINMSDADGITPLMWSVLQKNEEALLWLLNHDADIHRQNSKGQYVSELFSDWEEGKEIWENKKTNVAIVSIQKPVLKENQLSSESTHDETENETEVSNPFHLKKLKRK